MKGTLAERSNCIRGLSVKEATHVPCFALRGFSAEDIPRALDLFMRAADGGDLEARKMVSDVLTHE